MCMHRTGQVDSYAVEVTRDAGLIRSGNLLGSHTRAPFNESGQTLFKRNPRTKTKAFSGFSRVSEAACDVVHSPRWTKLRRDVFSDDLAECSAQIQ